MESKSNTIAMLLGDAAIDDVLRDKFVSYLHESTQSSKLHLNLLDNALEMITAIDKQKRILFWNKACEKDINIPLKQALGKSMFEVFPATKTNGFDELMDRVLSGEEIFITKRAYLHKPGFYEARMTPMYDKDGEIAGCINYVRDITDKIINEEKIQKTAALLAETQQLAKIGVFEWILDTDELYWSDEMYKIFGIDANTETVTPELYLSFLFVNNEIAAAKEFYKNPLLSDFSKPISFNRKIKKRDNTSAYISGSATFVMNGLGKPSRVTGFVQDITEKILVEQELEESKKFAQQIASASPHILYVYDLKKEQIVYVNREIKTMLGYKANETGFRPHVTGQQLVHPDDVAISMAPLQDFMNTKIADDVVKSYEYRVKDALGNWRYLNTRNMVFKRDEKGFPFQIIGSVQDVTELKMVEQNLLNLNAELKRSNQELEQFAYVASHDLKEPLRMISSYAQLLLRHVPQDDETAKLYAGFMKDGVSNINRLIDDLLQYSRVGSKEKVFTTVDCQAIVQEIKDALSIKLDETDAKIHCENLPTITGIHVLIKQLFQNLIENAIKFRGKNLPQIKITGYELTDYWKITVADNGIGIAPVYFERIFKLFQRLHTRDQHPGSGIGLAVCRKITDMHKGEIWVESVPGEGASFHFTISKSQK